MHSNIKAIAKFMYKIPTFRLPLTLPQARRVHTVNKR